MIANVTGTGLSGSSRSGITTARGKCSCLGGADDTPAAPTDHLDRKLSRNCLRLWNYVRGVCQAANWMDMGKKMCWRNVRKESRARNEKCAYVMWHGMYFSFLTRLFVARFRPLPTLFTPLSNRNPVLTSSASSLTANANSRSAARQLNAIISDSFRSR